MKANTLIRTGAARRGWPSHRAWAIECEPGGLIGVGWFDRTGSDYGQFSGYRSALFRTRRLARVALKLVKGPAIRGLWPEARVVPVRVCLDLPKLAEGSE